MLVVYLNLCGIEHRVNEHCRMMVDTPDRDRFDQLTDAVAPEPIPSADEAHLASRDTT
jgi:hypothetical protein